MKSDVITYNIIIHQAREALNLTCHEYLIADTIYHLSHNPNGEIYGWCYMSKNALGKTLGLSKQTAIKIIKSLEQKGLVVKDGDGRLLKTTDKWFCEVLMRKSKIGKESEPEEPKYVSNGNVITLKSGKGSLHNKDKVISTEKEIADICKLHTELCEKELDISSKPNYNKKTSGCISEALKAYGYKRTEDYLKEVFEYSTFTEDKLVVLNYLLNSNVLNQAEMRGDI